MKTSTIYILIANLWMMGIWFIEGAFAKMSFLITGILWLIVYVLDIHVEMKTNDLDFQLDKLKRNWENKKHEQIVKLLETIAVKNSKTKAKRK